MPNPLQDVVVIGAGIIGAAIAYELSRYELSITLLEREVEAGFGTSKANSGIIHGGHHTDTETLKGRLEWWGNQLWDPLCEELGFGFARVGELTIALTESDLGSLDHLIDNAEEKDIADVEMWSREQICAAEPQVTRGVIAGVFSPHTAVVNPYEAVFGLVEAAVANAVQFHPNSPVTGLDYSGDTWTVTTPTATLRSRFVINSAGLGAAAIAKIAGVDGFEIRGRKGEEYLLDKRLRHLVRHVIYPCPTPVSKGTLVIPTYDGTIMVGPTAEAVDDLNDTTTTTSGESKVFAEARRLVPSLSERDIIAQFAGTRATIEGDDFMIGPTEAPGFINVAGIQSPGLTAAPAIARYVADILHRNGLEMTDRSHLNRIERPVHFASLTTDAQRDLAAHDRRYRRIVCRCEFVTEGEVCDAIARGATTIDGLKFRTRAGMGRCQGGFCATNCLELLSSELGIKLSDVTKRGPGSWLVLDRPDGTTPGVSAQDPS
ncbi:MAG: NAD(P)/FAD-dependent oxidoreductase [Acidimicrobiales bacterium]|nr:NAD(P)/FAD-dependent oxidoreductase [Acidimicrobiales bacterium]